MSAERLRAMLSEATRGPWKWAESAALPFADFGVVLDAENVPVPSTKANAKVQALAPDAIALLADMGDAGQLAVADLPEGSIKEFWKTFLARLDALCGDER